MKNNKCKSKKINDILIKYQKLINENTYYIKRNWLFFTKNKIKYYAKISNHLDEEKFIEDIKKELSNYATNIIYHYGELD